MEISVPHTVNYENISRMNRLNIRINCNLNVFNFFLNCKIYDNTKVEQIFMNVLYNKITSCRNAS